ncbi:serine/threonine protein kinase [Asanoa ishikariensis]|uniref:non-specific serine/threonine protein kinase n=1 Tax=Asanoa ishikariensis TaxID=137265 RepID=A0A1H3KBR0_9ACTN|nr:Stk1 family PASTA domain-containing Ser/Thr kinase [Asanoa ishikariensis]GIF70425.1 serine/threonine protein kinase [Asanoa ishikariensis]SDY49553.1 serine/threonine protein kinase [Asanoa ishikariensis]
MTQARLLGGRYQVGELLGYGGMAEVHRGRDLRLGRDVAIKMLRTDLARDATFQMRFRREAQNAASLNHPAIVAVYDTGEEIAPTGETLPFIVMEFVNGRTLKEVLAAEGRLQPRRALEITADICAALEFSHRHGIIHRDIKPGNVMLTQNGQVKVMDFGIARALASGATTMTQTSAVIGTAQYLSPEQARGEPVDARSDVYAGGCVLFELLCGHPPFVGDSPVSVAYQHVREDPRAPSEINRDVTPPIDAIVLKALSKNPLNRYQSAGEMRADVLRAATGRPVMATPVMRDQETMAMGGANAATAVVRGPQGAATRTIPAAAVGDAHRRKRSNWVLAVLSVLGVLAVIALVAGLLVQNARGEKIEVVSVLGQPVATAQQTLTTAGFDVQTTPREDPECRENTVIEQNPAAGAKAAKDSRVTLTVCAGPGTVEVPNLKGQTKADVEREFESRKLVADFDEVNSSQPENTVLRVDKAGTSVKPGTKIKVEISNGQLKKVPNVVGKSREVAEALLGQAGFKVDVEEGQQVQNENLADKVIDQDPNADQEAKLNDTVTITVTVFEEPDNEPSGDPTSNPPGGNNGGIGDILPGIGGGNPIIGEDRAHRN